MNIAIYSRKSKFTGKGDSIENQIQLCSDYINLHYPESTINIYEDEGFSGGNTDRPKFKQLMQDAKNKKIDILICYRLDRVSRNIADFATLIDKLQDYNIGFISLKEQFDTTTPMGRAMMYISGVFAQLERETIAERVKDNMLQLAKTGRWLGGTTPTGFTSKEVYTDATGKERKLYMLVPIETEINTIKLIFSKFLELKSITKLETYLIQNDIKTKNGKNYCLAAIRIILTNPVYSAADLITYEYLSKKDCIMSANKMDFKGANGIMPYNRTKQSKNTSSKQNPTSEWIISIGEHKPIVSGKEWVEVQTILDRNKDKSFRKIRSQEALLSGLIKCSICGSYMRPKQSRMSADGSRIHYYYICELKEKSKKTKCNTKNIPGHTIDKEIIDEIKSYTTSDSLLHDKLTTDELNESMNKSVLIEQKEKILSEIAQLESNITNLLNSLSENPTPITTKYIISQIDLLGNKIEQLKVNLDNIEHRIISTDIASLNLSLIKNTIKHFSSVIDTATIEEKRELLRTIIECIEWDGKNIKISLFGAETIKKP